jgi:hypothetical protein
VSVGAPVIQLNPSSVTIVASVGMNPAAQSVQVTNGGTGTLTGLTVDAVAYGQGGAGWLTATLEATNAPTVLTLVVNSAPLPTGSYTAFVTVRSSNTSVQPAVLPVTLNVGSGSTGTILMIAPAGNGSGLVTSSPGGISCAIQNGEPGTTGCTANFATGTMVTLSASAGQGSVFDGWTGACQGTGVCVVTMSQALTVGVQFRRPAQ